MDLKRGLKNADPQRDVRAAELRDALGLTHRKIAAVLEFQLPESYHGGDNAPATYKIPTVKSAIKRGRELLKQVLTDDEEYEQYLERIKPGLKSWYEYFLAIQADVVQQLQKVMSDPHSE